MLTQWYENGDGVMICSTNGLRPDHQQADLVVTKLLLAESGHYILPVNQEDQTMTEDEKTEILRLWRGKKKTGQAAAREQSDNCHNHDNSMNIDDNKLQFNTETLEPELLSVPEPNKNDDTQDIPKISIHMDDNEPIQVLKVDTMDEEYDEKEQPYSGDQFPAHLPNNKLKYLSKLYRAIPEEFYTKTRRAPVTPRNARSWARNRKNSHFHLWEFCSGSGRLSFLAVCAGLMVMFPLDYRYGWDLGCASHRKLIDEIETNLAPDVEYMSPACRPWSIASTRRDLEQTQRERNEEMPTINYLKSKVKKQCRNHRGYIWEQPWSSAMWEHLEDNPGEKQRTDQCRFGACDEVENPILKPTGLQSSLALHHSLRRCKGHQGKKHGWLQGQFQGACRTTIAAIYPEALCRAIIKDVKRFISNKSTVFSDYYKCERCAMGRAATDDLRHSFIPGECRHGRWPTGEGPKDKKKAEQERREQDDLWETFRKEAIKNEKVGAGKVSAHSDFAFDNEQLLIFKMVMVKLLDESIKEFELAEMEKRDYEQTHWLQDPIALGWLKKVFKDYMNVQGVMSNLLPWSKPTPAPVLTLEQAPLRLLIQGSVMRWTIGRLEDLRELSASQIHEPMELDDDWMVAIFGNDTTQKDESASSSSAIVPAEQKKEDQEEPAGDLVPLDPPEHDSEEPDKIAVHPGGLKPTYDFRRIFKKLPRLALDDETAAKRLILGLHERLWHSGLTDTVNILRRCGMPYHVCRLAPDAVASCMICRKYSRAGRRPQHKGVNLSCNFNDLVQTDIFHFQDEIFLITVDEATRYKIATRCSGRFLKDILSALMNSWIRYFGPMRVLVTDQESSLMTVAAGEELQRLGIERRPAGTTSGRQGQKHTTTGLVEKHIDLIKLTMVKIQAEASRWGIEVQGEELAAEASMAQNTTMSVGGYSPVTMLFGILPRGFMDPEEQLHGDIEEGAAESTFERSLRLRQIALQASQAAILESRIARANRSQPQRLRVEDLVPGTTAVEIFREDGSGQGWRGPATILKIDEEAGNAMVDFQGKPYLLGLRHVRPLRDSFHIHFNTSSTTTVADAEKAMTAMKEVVESSTPYRPFTMGEVYIENGQDTKMVKFPKTESPTTNTMLANANIFLKYHYLNFVLHGIKFGKGMKTIMVPRYSKGVLITWPEGSYGIAITEHNSDAHLHIKEYISFNIDKLCHIYLYGYVFQQIEENNVPYKITKRRMPEHTSQPDAQDLPDTEMEEPEDNKRKGPDSRTVILAPEKKKQKIHWTSRELLHQRSLWWMLQRPKKYVLEPHSIWYELEVRWMRRKISPVVPTENYLLHCYSKKKSFLEIDIKNWEIYRVDQQTDTLTEEDVLQHWPLFETADREELRQFVDQNIFRKVWLGDLEEGTTVVDATWVRKFKRLPNGELAAKSRLCARGFLDPQRQELPTRSTTATRLSQRLVVSVAATHNFILASLDVSGAFLKGFTFEKVRQVLAKRGIVSPPRKVVVVPPPNTWRQLAHFDQNFNIPEESFGKFGLLCLKPAYGLNDAPLAWQMSLQETLEEGGGVQSLLDECLWHFKFPDGRLQGLISTHVDDLAIASGEQFLMEQQKKLNSKYGSIKAQRTPFTHCGCQYSELPGGGYKIDQQSFVDSLQCQEITNTGDNSRPLTAEELTKFRSALGGLLWLTATRLDLVADVSILQGRVTKATVGDLLMANSVIRKAKQKQYYGMGLTYRRFSTSTPWRLLAIHDASAAAKGRNYAQEGVIILLAPDHLRLDRKIHTLCGTDVNEEIFGGPAHILYAHGAKAKRICYSTSHAETLAAISGLETSTLVSLRLAEILMKDRKPTLQQLAALQEGGVDFLPVDSYTDCKDFFSLTTGATALPQDKSQRIYILAHREARIRGRLRWIILIPTESMTADPLTKAMYSRPLLGLMADGEVHFYNKDGHPIQARRLPVIDDFTEEQLEKGDTSWTGNYLSIKNIKQIQHHYTSSSRSTWSPASSTRMNLWLLTFLYFASTAGGMEDDDQCRAEDVSQLGRQAQAFILSVMVTAIFCLTYVLFWTRRTLNQLRSYIQIRMEDEVTPVIYRVMDLECHEMQMRGDLDRLHRQAAEARGDLDILFRTVRHASPHPDEPSGQRRRLQDNRPPAAEPDEERLDDSPQPASEEETEEEEEDEVDRLVSLAMRSRSRDDPQHGQDLRAGAGGDNRALRAGGGDGGSGEDAEGDPDDEDHLSATLEDENQAELERQRQEENLRIHYMLIQANNLGVHLHTEAQLFRDGRIPFGRVEQLYVQHAPFLPLPSNDPEVEDITIGYFRNEYFYVLRIGEEQPLNFRSLEGLHGYRCHYVIAERDTRLSPTERRDRLYNQLQYYQRL